MLRRHIVVLGIVLGVGLAGCNSGGGGGDSATPDPGVVLESLVVTPTRPSVLPGVTQQFTATARYSDGTTDGVTDEATWASSTPATATIADTGLATAVAVGTTTISATFEGEDGSSVLTVTAPPPITDRHSMANRCLAVKAESTDKFVALAGSSLTASADAVSGAESWFFKPTTLGKYLLYSRDKRYLAGAPSAVTTATVAGASTNWTIDADGGTAFTIVNSNGSAIGLDAGGTLVLVPAADAESFSFEAAGLCAPFPEFTTDSSGQSFKGRGVEAPALGFADVHIHISAQDFLGHAHAGQPVHEFGVEHALGSCADRHGPDGRQDFVGNIYGLDPTGTHSNEGWPTFADWPARDSLTHEGTYYKWVERAWKAGLRLAVNDLVENETLCTLQRNAAQDPSLNCNEMDSAVFQAGLMRQMEAYIDAQEGGPGKGWFRIVTSPAQARAVINDGKLAVVLGIEISHLFNCGIYRVAGQNIPASPHSGEDRTCSEGQIDTQLQRLYDLGVRQMFPLHEFDNGLGGNGIFDGVVLNMGNRYDTGQWWTTYDCPAADDQNQGYLYGAGAVMNSGEGQSFPPPQFFGNPIADGLANASGGQVPFYDTSAPQCNARAITPLGEYAIGKLMDKKIIIEIDHMELEMKSQVIAAAQARDPDYPLVSTHGGHGGLSNKQARDLLALGGIIYDSNNNAQRQVKFVEDELGPVFPDGFLFGVGFGSDINGMSAQPGPRSTPNLGPVEHPFTLFSGPGWGAQFDGLDPVVFDVPAVPAAFVPEGGEARTWRIDEEGIAHYGLIADYVEELRIEGGEDAITALYNSAEAYLQMWERTCNRTTGVVGCE